ncbi:MAG: helix-turn-helix domain-containing protein [Planctomycetaceae bacterium]|jgi:excisionase family DNA binding protein|nr:helix-turn-helix domain-containing protein [Planctomycetaceae bacterium]
MSEFYNLERAAEVLQLSPGEVNSLREQGKIRGFRDGSNWKFNREDVENYAFSKAKEKKANPFGLENDLLNENKDDFLTSENEQELPIMTAGSSTFEEFVGSFAELNINQENPPQPVMTDTNFNDDEDGLTLVSDEQTDDLMLDDGIIPLAGESERPADVLDLTEEKPKSDSGIHLAGDSAISLLDGSSGSGIDLTKSDSGNRIFDDDDMVIGGSGSGSGINLAGESGISLLDAAADSGFSLGEEAGGSDAILRLSPDDDIISLTDDEVDPDTATEFSTEGDFQLQADDDLFTTDDSESSSQVIAVEGDFANEIDIFSSIADEPSKPSVSLDKTASTATADSSSSDGDLFGTEDVSFGFGGGSGGGIDLTKGNSGATFEFSGGVDNNAPAGLDDSLSGVAVAPMATPGVQSPQFTSLSIAGLSLMTLFLVVGGTLMFELIRCMWSWSEPFTINSTILSLFGLGK